MNIECLDLKNFRNYKELHINLDSNINLFYGDNAQGKTNILEAVYMSATSKSHRGSKDREIISFKEDEAHLRVKANKKNIAYTIDMHIKKNYPKGIAVNGIPIRKISELFGIVNAVCFSPEDLNIIKDGPSERRRFIDLELCQLNPLYVQCLTNYNKVLIQRNKLLKEISFRNDWKETLDAWDFQLIQYGKEVIKHREKFINELNEVIEDIHNKLTGYKEELCITYEKSVDENEFEKVLNSRREEDFRQKMTMFGPHRDDLGFYINQMDLRKYGSQGQQRTGALSLKLSEIEIVKRKTGDNPILLLDDVLSELDEHRQSELIEAIGNIQTIITCTGIEDYLDYSFDIGKVFHVVNGTITEELYGGNK